MFGGFLAYGSGSEDARHANSDEARRILKKIREKSSKHACGVIMRCLYGEFTRLAELLRRSGIGQESHTASHGSRTILARGGLCPRRTPLSVCCGWILIGVGDRVAGFLVGRFVCAPRVKTKCLNLSNALCLYMIVDSIGAVLRFGGCESCDYCRWTTISGRRPRHVAIS